MSWKRCPTCKSAKVACIDSRWALGRVIRRYECISGGARTCGTRFTTEEKIVPSKRESSRSFVRLIRGSVTRGGLKR